MRKKEIITRGCRSSGLIRRTVNPFTWVRIPSAPQIPWRNGRVGFLRCSHKAETQVRALFALPKVILANLASKWRVRRKKDNIATFITTLCRNNLALSFNWIGPRSTKPKIQVRILLESQQICLHRSMDRTKAF